MTDRHGRWKRRGLPEAIPAGPGALPRAPRALLFDLDGTLVDSVPDIARAANAALADVGRPQVSERNVRDWVGNGARVLLARCIAGDAGAAADPREVERAFGVFLERYGREICVDSRLYPGAEAALAAFAARGARLGCVTNKPKALAEALLAALGVAARFDVVVGGDSVAKPKPAPEPLLAALDALGVEPPAAVLVGDSVNDVAAARAAGVAVVCVSYGYNHGADIRAAGADVVVDSLEALPALLAVESG